MCVEKELFQISKNSELLIFAAKVESAKDVKYSLRFFIVKVFSREDGKAVSNGCKQLVDSC